MYKFTLIIPIFNEEKNISRLYNEISQCKAIEFISNIIYIDDASNDKSQLFLKDIANKDSKVIILTNSKNLGQSHSIFLGIKKSNTDYVITLDGDGQNDPNDIINLINIFNSNRSYGLIAGIRRNRKDNFIKILTSKIANNIRKIYLNDDCDDTGCALKLFEKSLIVNFKFFNGIHRFLPAIYKGMGKKCYFINVNHRHRKYGNSKYGTFNRLFVGIRDMLKVKKLIKNHKQ